MLHLDHECCNALNYNSSDLSVVCILEIKTNKQYSLYPTIFCTCLRSGASVLCKSCMIYNSSPFTWFRSSV